MSFKAFDKSKMDTYAAQAKEKWGKTQAYKEFEEKSRGQSLEQQLSAGDRLMDIFREFGEIRDQDPAGLRRTGHREADPRAQGWNAGHGRNAGPRHGPYAARNRQI